MAQTNYTPISLYYSTTASAVPTAANLVPGELAINTNDGKLYYEDSSGVVRVLATKSTGTIGGSTTQVQYNSSGSLAGSANMTFNGTSLSLANNIGIGGATPTTSGSGITFPTTQSASSNANTLDDYEEGTWTPIDASSSGLTFTGVSAYYTKIGNMVFATFELVYPATSSSALNIIGGLPFTTATGDAMNAFNVSYTTYSPGLMSPLDANATTFTLYDTTTVAAINNLALLSKLVRGTCIYKVA
jgi:hypothetical protein